MLLPRRGELYAHRRDEVTTTRRGKGHRMTSTDISLLSCVVTACIIVVIYFATRLAVKVWRLFSDLADSAKHLSSSVVHVTATLKSIESEMAYMRSMVQQQGQGSQPPAPLPPIGRAGTMPPPFPTPEWNRFVTVEEDAKPEDTDKGLLEQTDEELMQAQAIEELRSKGIDVDMDELPQNAVVDEA